MNTRAFISYSTTDKHIAGALRAILAELEIDAFLAHEDIAVSEEWRQKLLEEISRTEIFVCILSKAYFASPWCIQESGIAAFRKEVTIIPLSVDGSSPKGFFSNVQATKVDIDSLSIKDLLPGFLKHNFDRAIAIILKVIAQSRSFRSAESNFQLILPHLEGLGEKHVQELLEQCAANDQIHHASLCAKNYIPPLLKSHGHLLKRNTRALLKNACKQYA